MFQDTANDTETFSVPGSDAIYEQDFVLHDGATSGDWTISVFRGGQVSGLTKLIIFLYNWSVAY